VLKINELFGPVATMGRAFAMIVLHAGIPPREDGVAQKVPPCPSVVKHCRAGITLLLELYAQTCLIVSISVSNVLLDNAIYRRVPKL
jgi:hypothetical protein